MTDHSLYQTTLSAKARRGLILNVIAAFLLALISGGQWFAGGHWIQVLIFCLTLGVGGLVALTLMRSKNPLEVYSDRVVLNSLMQTAIPVEKLIGIGTHPKRGTPSLSYRDDTGKQNELLIHWRFIREPQEEVITQINQVLEGRG